MWQNLIFFLICQIFWLFLIIFQKPSFFPDFYQFFSFSWLSWFTDFAWPCGNPAWCWNSNPIVLTAITSKSPVVWLIYSLGIKKIAQTGFLPEIITSFVAWMVCHYVIFNLSWVGSLVSKWESPTVTIVACVKGLLL